MITAVAQPAWPLASGGLGGGPGGPYRRARGESGTRRTAQAAHGAPVAARRRAACPAHQNPDTGGARADRSPPNPHTEPPSWGREARATPWPRPAA